MDFCRLVFTFLVMLAHAPEILDGDNHRELFSRLTRTPLTFGTVAVDGFFLLSGYVIVQSWVMRPVLLSYLRNRILRIVPGYVVACVLSLLVMGSFGSSVPHFFRSLNLLTLKSMLELRYPATPLVFPRLHVGTVNSSLWTIAYEFRCYVLVALFGVAGLFRRRALWGALTVLLLAVWNSDSLSRHLVHVRFVDLLGESDKTLRLFAAFTVGACFYLFRERIPLRRGYALLALLALGLGTLAPLHFETALVLFGGYLLFFFCSLELRSLRWMHRLPDMSYGIYLYAWPIQVLWYAALGCSPWVNVLLSAPVAGLFGLLSWRLVEKPMLRLKSVAPRRPNENAGMNQASRVW